MPENRRDVSDQRITTEKSNQNITFSIFDSYQRLHTHPCRIRNHSETGMCFESLQPLHPGTVLCILREQPSSPGGAAPTARDTALAEVMWCRPDKTGDKEKYCVGVRYY